MDLVAHFTLLVIYSGVPDTTSVTKDE